MAYAISRTYTTQSLSHTHIPAALLIKHILQSLDPSRITIPLVPHQHRRAFSTVTPGEVLRRKPGVTRHIVSTFSPSGTRFIPYGYNISPTPRWFADRSASSLTGVVGVSSRQNPVGYIAASRSKRCRVT